MENVFVSFCQCLAHVAIFKGLIGRVIKSGVQVPGYNKNLWASGSRGLELRNTVLGRTLFRVCADGSPLKRHPIRDQGPD